MARITPAYRKETAEAWALGLAGGLFAVTELGVDLSKEYLTKAGKFALHRIEALQEQQTESVIGSLLVNTPPSYDFTESTGQENGAEVIQLHPNISDLPSALPLEAA